MTAQKCASSQNFGDRLARPLSPGNFLPKTRYDCHLQPVNTWSLKIKMITSDFLLGKEDNSTFKKMWYVTCSAGFRNKRSMLTTSWHFQINATYSLNQYLVAISWILPCTFLLVCVSGVQGTGWLDTDFKEATSYKSYQSPAEKTACRSSAPVAHTVYYLH